MPDEQTDTAQIPPDDPAREAVDRDPDEDGLCHLAVVGDTYTILLSGEDTGGAYALIDMLVPEGGGPPPHRHDFEEMFTVLEGEIEVTFRGVKTTLGAGRTMNVPANSPHQFTNASAEQARLLCMCTPAGQEEFFAAVWDTVPSRTSPPADLSEAELKERLDKAAELAPRYRTELIED